MEAVIESYRRGVSTQKDNQMVLIVKGTEDKEKAKALVGKKVTWKSPAGKEITGKVSGIHGNKGRVKVLFEKGMPGQSLGTKVQIE